MNEYKQLKKYEPIPIETEKVAKSVLDAAFMVHNEFGPGLLESVYKACLVEELRYQGLKVDTEVTSTVKYRNIVIKTNLRIDLLVNDCLIVEVKTVEKLLPIHKAQLATYLKITGNRLGLLINFNNPMLKDGIKRVVIS